MINDNEIAQFEVQKKIKSPLQVTRKKFLDWVKQNKKILEYPFVVKL